MHVMKQLRYIQYVTCTDIEEVADTMVMMMVKSTFSC